MKLWETWELYQSKQCNKNSYDVSRVSSDDNGLYYMRARYYNVSIKRFINQDVVTGNMAESQSLNRYAYVEGNPVSYLDPFGLEKKEAVGTIAGTIATVEDLGFWVYDGMKGYASGGKVFAGIGEDVVFLTVGKVTPAGVGDTLYLLYNFVKKKFQEKLNEQ